MTREHEQIDSILSSRNITNVIKNFSCSAESIKNYLKQGYEITNSDDPKEDTLWNAIAYGLDDKSIMLLINNGAKINNSEELHQNTLYCALKQTYLISTYEFLIKKGAEPTKLDEKSLQQLNKLTTDLNISLFVDTSHVQPSQPSDYISTR
jgi:hypothetical protein